MLLFPSGVRPQLRIRKCDNRVLELLREPMPDRHETHKIDITTQGLSDNCRPLQRANLRLALSSQRYKYLRIPVRVLVGDETDAGDSSADFACRAIVRQMCHHRPT